VKFGPTKNEGQSFGFQLQRMKTAVLYHVREHPEYAAEIATREAALQRGERKI